MNIEVEKEMLEILQQKLDRSQRVVEIIDKVIYNEYDVNMDLKKFFEENQRLVKQVEYTKQLIQNYK